MPERNGEINKQRQVSLTIISSQAVTDENCVKRRKHGIRARWADMSSVSSTLPCIDKRHTFGYNLYVTFDWNDEKNAELKKTRNISFEEMVICINENQIIEVLEHPNKEKYPNQRIYVIWYRNYAYAVPFVNDEEKQEIFLKTIFPSRLYTKRYRQEVEKDE